MAITVRINGKPETAEAPATISAILDERKIRPEVVVVQVNRETVRAPEFASREIADGDVVDVLLQFAGGENGAG